mmetsp:Transcript_51087/g.101658  ORF Transcript_51087/g.101658 Transcript_51087/m.101658 type:complete len:111 (-) Transcript_51087:46-378(-)
MAVTTLRDLEGRQTRGSFLPLHSDTSGNVSCGATGNMVWYFPLGAIVALSLVLTLLHPPLVIVVAIECGILFINGSIIMKVGRESVPIWVWLLCLLQALQLLRDLGLLIR